MAYLGGKEVNLFRISNFGFRIWDENCGRMNGWDRTELEGLTFRVLRLCAMPMRFAFLGKRRGKHEKRLDGVVLVVCVPFPFPSWPRGHGARAWFVHMESAGRLGRRRPKGFLRQSERQRGSMWTRDLSIQRVVGCVRVKHRLRTTIRRTSSVPGKKGDRSGAVSVDFQTSAMASSAWTDQIGQGYPGNFGIGLDRCQGEVCRGGRLGETVHDSEPGGDIKPGSWASAPRLGHDVNE